MSVREQRLRSEYENLRKMRSKVVSWMLVGDSKIPDRYEFTFKLKSIIGINTGKAVFHDLYKVLVEFGSDYPRVKPEVRLISSQRPWPIHPNIFRDGRFCLEGDQNWIPGVGVPLDSIIQMVGEILAYQEVNVRSPANADPILLEWIKKNLFYETGSNTKIKNPIDSSPIRLPDIDDLVKWGGDDQDTPPTRIVFGD